MTYDLKERTIAFSKEILRIIQTIRLRDINRNIINQLLRSSTSVGANYREACGASSQKDFKNKLHICKKEIEETVYWIELLAEVETAKKEKLRTLWQEATELTKIFGKSIATIKQK